MNTVSFFFWFSLPFCSVILILFLLLNSDISIFSAIKNALQKLSESHGNVSSNGRKDVRVYYVLLDHYRQEEVYPKMNQIVE